MYNLLKKVSLAIIVLLVLIILFGWFRLATFEIKDVTTDNIEKVKEVSPEEVAANKEVVQSYYQALYSEESNTAITNNLADNYIEHQPSAEFTKSGLETYVAQRLADNPDHKITIHRVIAQGDLVFLHVEENLNNDVVMIRGELFRLQDGKISEHWAVEQEEPKETASGNRMIDGASVNYDSNDGRKYALEIARDYMHDFTNYDVENIAKNTTDRYIQHNPDGNNGKSYLIGLLDMMKYMYIMGTRIDLDIKKTIAEGDFVVTYSYFEANPAIPKSMVFDLYRVTEDGKKDEHWDVLENIGSANLDKVF